MYYNNDKYFLVLVIHMFVKFYFFSLLKAENNILKKPVGQNVVIPFVLFLLKVGSVRPVDQQINFVLP